MKVRKWHVDDSIPKRLYLEELVDGYNGLKLIMKGESENDERVELHFEEYYSYRNTDESYLLKTVNSVDLLSDIWTFYIADESDYLRWFKEESRGIVQEELYHYIVTTPNDVIEIIASEDPVIKFIDRV